MSFRCEGVTHCMKCAKVLKMDEIGMCKECEPLNKTYGIKRLSRLRVPNWKTCPCPPPSGRFWAVLLAWE